MSYPILKDPFPNADRSKDPQGALFDIKMLAEQALQYDEIVVLRSALNAILQISKKSTTN